MSITKRIDAIEDRAAHLPRERTAMEAKLATLSVPELLELKAGRLKLNAGEQLTEQEKARAREIMGG